MEASDNRYIILYDGECGLCRHLMQWLKSKSGKATLVFLPYQQPDFSTYFPDVSVEEAQRGLHLKHLDGRTTRNEEAVARLLKLLPGWSWLGSFILFPLIRPLGKFVYHAIAKNRRLISRLFLGQSCGT